MRRRFLSNIKSISGGNHSKYFTIEALEDGLTAKLSKNASEYRIDDGSWNTLSANTNTPSVNKGQTLSFKGSLTPNSSNGIGTFTISKKCNVKGNIMSLLYGDDFEGQIDLSGKNWAFLNLFYNCTTIQNAENLILPATTLANWCYQYMFDNCTSLTSAPELPATTLANWCYSFMFDGCTGLTSAPELPATTLADYCYYKMFNGCKSLITAPELPVTTLVNYCYSFMFDGCTGLTTVPELPATTLASDCYNSMFSGCSKLTTAPKLPATTLANHCYYSMFSGCKSLTTAPELPATTLADYCYNSMFSGCSKLTTAPELPATTLASGCYSSMFWSCTSLTSAPELPATTLVSDCYYSMFTGCNNLNHIKMLATDISASGCLDDWVYGVSSTGTFVKHPDMTTLPSGISGIPDGWTVVDYYTIISYKELTIKARDVVWNKTNTTITWSVLCDAITNQNEVIEVTKTGETVSDTFEQNTSDSDVIREITFSYMGLTATTTIIQSAYSEIPVGYDEYLTFTNTGEDTLLISLLESNYRSIYPHSFSIDNGEWVEANDDTYALITPGQTVRFKSNFNSFTYNGDEEPVIKFFLTSSLEENNPSCSVSGNIMSLIHGDDFVGVEDLNGYDCAFVGLFASEVLASSPSCITDASNLILPATALANYCYWYMFQGCTNLTTAPELPAITLADSCYSGMFIGCNNLNHIKMLATDISASDCLNNWVYDVASSGTFVKNTAMTTLPSGISGIPDGWTVVDN